MDIYRAQREAEKIMVDLVYPEKAKKKIYFDLAVITNKTLKITKCVWVDPSFGFFGIAGQEDKGFTRVKELDESLVTRLRFYGSGWNKWLRASFGTMRFDLSKKQQAHSLVGTATCGVNIRRSWQSLPVSTAGRGKSGRILALV